MADREAMVKLLDEVETCLDKECEWFMASVGEWEEEKLEQINMSEKEVRAHIGRAGEWGLALKEVKRIVEEESIPPPQVSAVASVISDRPRLSTVTQRVVDAVNTSLPDTFNIHQHDFIPPYKGTPYLTVDLPGKSLDITDLCWTPEGHLLVVKGPAKQVWKVELMTEDGQLSYSASIVCSGEKYQSVSCGRDGMWGVVVIDDHIKLYHPGSDKPEVWKPAEVPKPFYISIQDREIYVTSNRSGTVYMYDRDKTLIRSLIIDENCAIQAISPTEGRVLATTGRWGQRLHIYNTHQGSVNTVRVLRRPAGVSTGPTGHILVADYDNNRVSVLTPGGKILHHLSLAGSKDKPWCIAVRGRHGRRLLLAVGGKSITVYELQ